MKYNRKLMSVLFIILYTVLYYTWIIFYKGNNYTMVFVSDMLQTIPPIILSVLLLNSFIKTKGNRNYFFLLLLLGCGSYLISQIAWDYYELFLGIRNPVFGWSMYTWATNGLSYIAAILFKIHQKRKGRDAWMLFIDTMTVMCIAFALTWVYILMPISANLPKSNIFVTALYIAYPLANLVSLFVSINLYMSLQNDDPERSTLYLVSFAYFVMFLVNMLYSYMTVTGEYSTGSLIDPLWSLYLLILILAVLDYVWTENRKDSPSANDISKYHSIKIANILPIVSVVFLFGFMWMNQELVVWLCSATSIILITIRHGVAILQNNQLISKLKTLNESLDFKVKERTKDLYNMAYYDQLTGLPNRRMFENQLHTALDYAGKNETAFAVMLIDLDRFKNINDTLGHSFGDTLLIEVSRRLYMCLGDDCIISRQGGDEFAIIIENSINKNNIINEAHRVLSEILKPFELNGHHAYITCSIGIALYPENGKDCETLLRRADAAMYHSKEQGKNTYKFYNTGMDTSIFQRLNIERELRQALENDEFRLFYQPQYNSLNNEIIGVEALIRWFHPDRGIIPPSNFIPIAEETGMIDLIGNWVLKTACTQAAEWQGKGLRPVKIGVNISPYQFFQEDFIQSIEEVLNDTKLSPQYLDIEITEGISIQNEPNILSKLHRLKGLGVKISIDDFGTGYSSLNYLNEFPIDTLKIAQQFVREIGNDNRNKAIISAIIAIARNLNLTTVAEGVETEDQLEFLKSQNCFNIQGYIFSKPIPPERFEDLLRDETFSHKKSRLRAI